MPFENGEVFAGYVIQRLLGTGGSGEVYLAQHPRLPRQDALKVLSLASTADDEFRARFNREAELAATLWHPHIVGVLDRGEFNGRLWISMDYVDGTDAGRLIRETYPRGMPEQDVWEIVTAVADALDFGHERQLLHRDVKPENILVTASDGHRRRVLLTDFGIARRIDDASNLTNTNIALGTINYVAPEQLLGRPLDGRADQYALAATTFHLLTGSPVFPGLESRRHHQPPSGYVAAADIGPSTRSRAPRRCADEGAGQRPDRALPDVHRLRPSPHAAESTPCRRGPQTAELPTTEGVGAAAAQPRSVWNVSPFTEQREACSAAHWARKMRSGSCHFTWCLTNPSPDGMRRSPSRFRLSSSRISSRTETRSRSAVIWDGDSLDADTIVNISAGVKPPAAAV